jgi:hypothetical protein
MNRILSLLVLPALLVGCSHQIVITPDVSQLEAREVTPIERNVGYFISPQDRELTVTTPGGGGDKVSYLPYKELEPALFKVLSNVFRRAYPVDSPTDAKALSEKDISYVFVPVITTDSSSESAFTWPPTKFKVELACRALGPDGKTAWEQRIVGEGEASFNEFKSDLPLAAKRASLKAMAELQRQLNASTALRAPQARPIAGSN